MKFLNSGAGYALFAREARKRTYVDKSMLIDEVYRFSQDINAYICVTRPRRFGKSVAANMLSAFFDAGTAKESRELFEKMEIGKHRQMQEKAAEQDSGRPLCWTLQGTQNVIRINMIELLTGQEKNFQDFYDTLQRLMTEDLHEAYPSLRSVRTNIPEMLEKTGDSFIFVIDEWDAVFEAPFMTEQDKQKYLLFLKSLLKDRRYVHFAYMTGILPIAKYTSGSPLNMFREFTSFQDAIFYPYFGLTEQEISELMQKRGFLKPTIEDLTIWYDGYTREDGKHVFNPASVCMALADGVCHNNWTGTGPMNEIRDLIQKNVKDLRGDVLRMVSGETLEIRLTGFAAEKTQVSTRDEILSAMVVYGFLSYDKCRLRIPNHELMLKFQEALASEQMGLRQTLDESRKLLRATLARDHREIACRIEELHDEKIPFFQYNDENSLAAVVTVGYLAALDYYRITREAKAGKGFVDFLFEPIKKGDTAIILELKYNHSAKNALKCIHDRDYVQRFKDQKQILLVGINYSERTKKHTCLTELVEPG